MAATTQAASGGGANEIVAASASLAHVQAAVNSAPGRRHGADSERHGDPDRWYLDQ